MRQLASEIYHKLIKIARKKNFLNVLTTTCICLLSGCRRIKVETLPLGSAGGEKSSVFKQVWYFAQSTTTFSFFLVVEENMHKPPKEEDYKERPQPSKYIASNNITAII